MVKAFKMNYSWNIQEQKLLKAYSNLLEGGLIIRKSDYHDNRIYGN